MRNDEKLDAALEQRNQRTEGHLIEALTKLLNHHIYEYPTLTENQIIGCLQGAILNYYSHGFTETIREAILEVMSDHSGEEDEDDEEEEEED